jgi:integrase
MASFEDRGNSVRAIVRLPGGAKKTSTFDTRLEAEAWADRMEKKKVLGLLKPSQAGGVTNEELFEAFLDAVASKSDSAKWNRLRLMKWCKDPLAAMRVGNTLTHDINEWINRSLAKPNERTGKVITGATVNRELNLMSAAFAYAVKDRQWITVNPCHGARRPEQGKRRKRVLLTPEEISAIRISTGYDSDPDLRTLTSRVGACFLLTLETGMRSGEVLRLRPPDYRREISTIHVAAIEQGGRKSSKSGRSLTDPSRNVPLTARAIELLDQLLRTMPKDQPYIVGVDDVQRDSLWRKARDQAGVVNLHFHDTKHEAATRLARFIDVLALSHALGTKDVRLLRDVYYNDDAQRSAALLPAQLSLAVRAPVLVDPS